MTQFLILASAIFGWLVCLQFIGFEGTIVGLLACILTEKSR